jgi:short-subunit dehydrogenase
MSYVLITGASKGIGKALAGQFGALKYNLLLVARSANLLAQLANQLENEYNIQVKYLAADLSVATGVHDVAAFIEQENLPVNILVNNAGYGLWGSFEQLDINRQLNMIRLNNECILTLTYALLPVLKRQQQSYILNIASTTAYQAVPYMSVYAASKAFVLAFTRGLATELKGSNISVTCVSPGATHTNFMEQAGMHSQKIIQSAEKVSMDADTVARQAVNALFTRKTEHIPGWLNKVTAYANNFVPKKLIERIAASIYRP